MGRRTRSLLTVAVEIRIMQGAEQIDQRRRDLWGLCQGFDHRNQAVAEAGLAQIAKPGPHPHRRAGIDTRGNDQLVEGVVFSLTVQHTGDRLFDLFRPDDQTFAFLLGPQFEQKVVNIAQAAAIQRSRNGFQHGKPEILQRRDSVRQRQCTAQMIDFQSQQMIGIAGQPVKPGRPLTAPLQLEQPHDILGRFQGTICRLIGSGETISIALRQDRRPVFLAGFAQIAFNLRFPAPDHIFQLLVKQVGIGNFTVGSHVERVSQGRDATLFQRIGPAQDLRPGRLGKHVFDILATLGRELLPRQPDEGKQMTGQWRNYAVQFGPRPVDQGHRDQGEFLEIVLCECDQEIMRQRGQGMGKALPGMAGNGKFKLVQQPGMLGPQHRYRFRWSGQRGAGPHAGSDRQRRDFSLVLYRHDDQVHQDMAMHCGKLVGFDDQRGFPSLFKPFERASPAFFGKDWLRPHPGNAQLPVTLALWIDDFVAQQCEVAVKEPSQQGGTLSFRQCNRLFR